MRWPKRRGADDQSVTDSAEETSAEPMRTACAAEGAEATEPAVEVSEQERDQQPVGAERGFRWTRAITYGLLPGLALLLAPAAGYLKWQDASTHDSQVASADAVRAATDGTIALLSYKPDTVDKDLEAARSRLTGTFLNAYTSLTHDVVIPGAKQKQVSAVATVPAAASVRATANHAVVLLCVNQSVIIGQDASTTTASSVRVSLDKIGGRWLISQFDPV
jgi:Mce-associated membrane protein